MRPVRTVVVSLLVVGSALALVGCKQRPPTTFEQPVAYGLTNEPATVALADVTGDGTADAVVGLPGEIVVLPGGPAGTFGVGIAVPMSNEGIPRAISTGDLDSDGLIDVVAAVDDRVERWERAGASLVVTTPLTVEANVVRVDDVTGDGLHDLVALGDSSDALSVLPQQLDGTLGSPTIHTLDVDGQIDLEIGDLDSDGDNDVIALSSEPSPSPQLTVLLQDGDGELAARGSWSVPQSDVVLERVAIGNFDLDEWAEVAASHVTDDESSVVVFDVDETGELVQGDSLELDFTPLAIEVNDMNGDRYDDLVITNADDDTMAVLYGGPAGVSLPAQKVDVNVVGELPEGVALTDVDGDGDVDVGLASTADRFVYLRNNADLPLPTTTTFPLPAE
jgi:hypothetical protein